MEGISMEDADHNAQAHFERHSSAASTVCSDIESAPIERSTRVSLCVERISLRPQQRLPSSSLTSKQALVLHDGLLAIDVAVGKGQRQILDFLMPGDVLSTIDVSMPKECSVRAITKSSLGAEQFEGAVDVGLAVDHSRMLARQAQLQLARGNVHQMMIGHLESEARIASFLLAQSLRCRSGIGDLRLAMPMSRDDIADYLAMNRDTLSRNMMRFETLGIIKRINRRMLLILDLKTLKSMTPLAGMISGLYERSQNSCDSDGSCEATNPTAAVAFVGSLNSQIIRRQHQ
jgi:CRP/FNR family transcriptional regulator, anaerobic regulatory protein